MPLLLLIGLGGLGTGYVLGLKTSHIVATIVVGGVVYYYITRSK